MIVILAKMEARAPTWETTTLNVSVPQALEETLVKKVTNLRSLFLGFTLVCGVFSFSCSETLFFNWKVGTLHYQKNRGWFLWKEMDKHLSYLLTH